MTLHHLFDNTAGPPSVNYPAGASHQGMVFKSSATGQVVKLRYYKGDNNVDNVPTYLRLWDKASGALLRDAETIPGQGEGSGWKDHTLAIPYSAAANQELMVSLYRTGSIPNSTSSTGSVSNAPAPLSFVDKSGDYQVANDPDIIPLVDHGVATWVDIEWDTAVGVGGTENLTPLGFLQGMLAWFGSGVDNLFNEGLPWLTHALSVSIDTAVAETKELIDALAGAGAAMLWGTPAEKMQSLGNVLRAIWEEAPQGVPRMETAILDHTTEQATAVNLHTTNIYNALVGPSAVPIGTGAWSLTSTVVGSGGKAHRVAADAYVLTITNLGSHLRQQTLVDDVYIFYMRGFAWWLNGQEVGHRQELNALVNVIRQPGTRYPGVLIDVPSDLAWSLASWDYVV